MRPDSLDLASRRPLRVLKGHRLPVTAVAFTFNDRDIITGSADARAIIWESATGRNEFVLRADLPGLSEDDVNIELEDNVLSVSGERKAEHEERKEGYYRVERSSGAFSRSLTLPEGVDPEGVKASFDRGVLEVRIPKPEERKPRKVAISVGGTEAPKTIEGSEHNGAAASAGEPAAATTS